MARPEAHNSSLSRRMAAEQQTYECRVTGKQTKQIKQIAFVLIQNLLFGVRVPSVLIFLRGL